MRRRLLTVSLRLLPLGDLLMELLVCMLELPGSRLDQGLELSGRILPVQQVLANLVLPSSSTQSCSYGADQSDGAERPLDQRDIAQVFQQSQPVRMGECRGLMAGEHDERKIRPGRLVTDPGFQFLGGAAKKRLFCHDGDGSTPFQIFEQVLQIAADGAADAVLREIMCRSLRIPPDWSEHKDALFQVLSDPCHRSFQT